MKSLTAWTLAGALLILVAPMTAQAYEWGARFHHPYGWRHRDIVNDRRDIHRDWRDVKRDRWALRQDLANRNWGAARAEQADIYRDLGDINKDRRDLYRDYNAAPGRNIGYTPLSYENYPAQRYRPLPNGNYYNPAGLAGQSYPGLNGFSRFLP